MIKFPYAVKGCYLAGGAVLSSITKSEISDYDLYPKTRKDAIEAIAHLCDAESGFICYMTPKAVTIKMPDMNVRGERMLVQVMLLHEYTTAEQIFEKFDFTVCMAAVDLDDQSLHVHPDFWKDVASRTLRFNPGTLFPVASLTRTIKYQKKGYHISKSELIRISMAIVKSAPGSWDELASALGGAYGYRVSFDEIDIPFSLDAAMDKLAEIEFHGDQPIGLDKYLDSNYDWETICNALELYWGLEPQSDHSSYSIKANKKIELVDGKFKTNIDQLNVKAAELPDFLKPQDDNPTKHVIDSATLVKAYKVFSVDSDGILHPVVKPLNSVTYRYDTVTSWDKSPFMYVAKNLISVNNYALKVKTSMSVVHEVFFRLADVKDVNHDSWQVSKLYVGNRVMDHSTLDFTDVEKASKEEADWILPKLLAAD